ncbi:TonB-dependent receptor [Novosphingobium album (ex Hu et al. 2023)]|uniref:TonB-dependent receptor n=1 Tax=Novosphingobium album (ex Hu et al. 2023) TaxID=2930093 RepID=A0ABT0AYQ6_9SPHN|nr:TonB-dependent receptor [Novosphingobium album (ex Hu et al. 2023)]MCJ2177780.1 TonB-dependent receptor [Novosphingobium album (ex Hu et al. 2023)]
MNRKIPLLAATALVFVEPWTVAQAQSAGDVGAPEIIVTARKRQESILKVPVVETVLDSSVLQQSQITDMQAVTTKVPGLFVGTSVLAIGSQISLRGVGTSALDAGIDQSVSLNIDGQQFSQGLTFKSGLFDLAQAEVLKGPQALFFGKNSPGGVIALTTADPGNEVEVIARASYEFEAREPRTELILSGPLSDTLGARLAGTWSDRKGYFKNTAVALPGLGGTTLGGRNGSNENWIVRGTLLWQPSTDFKARLKVNVTRDNSDSPSALQGVSCPYGTGPGALGIQFLGGTHPCREDREVEYVGMDANFFGGVFPDGSPALRNGGVPFTDIKQHFGVLEMDYNVTPDIALTSTTTYYHNTTDTMANGVYSGAAGPTLFADNHFKRRDTTQELRLESDFKDSPLNFLVGGYYQDARMKNRIYVGGNTALGLPATLTAGTHDVDIKSASLFGQLRWKPVETLEIAGGVRWTDETRKDAATTLTSAATNTYTPVDLITPKINSKNWSPELTVTYTPTDNFTVFGALKQGYKSGSYSITTPASSTKDNSFGDEKVQGGEIGFKARTADRSLNVNTAFYYYKFKGLQVGVSQPADTNGIPELRTLNAGSSRTYGIDFDATYRPPEVPGLGLNLSVNWNRAKFLSLHGVPCYGGQTIALGCTESEIPGSNPQTFTASDASGEPLEKAPVWQVIGGFDYDTSISDSMNLVFGGSAQASTKYKAVIGEREDYYQRGYAKLNAYITLKGVDDRWELSLIGNNLNDVLRAGYCANTDLQNTTVFTRFAQVTGQATNPTGKTDDVGCVVEPGRSVFIKLTLRPLGMFQ